MKNTLLKKGIVLLLGLFLFSSCQEDEIDSIFFRTDGGLSAVIKDGEDAPIVDAKVSLYNLSTDNRVDVQYSSENGVVDFGRFEAGEYSLQVELTHNGDWFSLNEEVHVISGSTINHEINLEDHYGNILIKLRDSNNGELLDLDLDVKIGLIPYNDALFMAESNEEIITLVTKTIAAKGTNDLIDIPSAEYLIILYSNNKIIASEYRGINAFDRSYINFYISPITILLESKSNWTLTSVNADTPNENLIPITSLSFDGGDMLVNFSNGESDPAGYYFYGNGSFDWYSVGSNSYYFYFSTNDYVINSNGSITFNFGYWETYDNNLNEYFYSDNVSLTFN